MLLWSNVELNCSRTVNGGVLLTQFAQSAHWAEHGDLSEALRLFLTDQDGPVAGVVAEEDFRALLAAAHRLQRHHRRTGSGAA